MSMFDDSVLHLSTSSISDCATYRGVCNAAVSDEAVFARFRQLPDYTAVLEHVTTEQGALYRDEVLHDSPMLLDPGLLLPNDAQGGPVLAAYAGLPAVSPTTLRYLKVLSDLMKYFGPLDGMRVIEVGAGYGGQARLIRARFPSVGYTILDLSEPLALARKYLQRSGVSEGVSYIACCAAADVPVLEGDLFLSNYALTECAPTWYEAYVQRVALNCARGYITGNAQEALTFRHLEPRRARRLDERPLTAEGNYLCVWGPS